MSDPEGLLAAGGDLTPSRLVNAYTQGIFPWYEDDQPILWWSPNPRTVVTPDAVHVSRSLRKQLNKNVFSVTCDSCFERVIDACAEPRSEQGGTWITEEMRSAYIELHRLGIAHSVEVFYQDQLVGGLYGVSLGKVFFGESMFSRMSNASKVAFATLGHNLALWGFELIDCQVHSNHLTSLGASNMQREEFAERLTELIGSNSASNWPRHAQLVSA
ncbi:leucyl/phenylalanyl-tRNA--protein transferase [Gilvimarinus sp. SDUM040013]|nr:leucyl/phenylalanyl-tRNA--protein transferase [Gilvimarinus sp. SDUM040013]